MDPTRFDALARTLFAATSRRGAIGLLLGAGLSGFGREALARWKKRTAGKGNASAQRLRKRKGDGGATRRNAKARNARSARAETARCCSTGNCAPGKGRNLAGCCYGDQNLSGKNVSAANLGSANFAGTTLTRANVQAANLGKACFVDADLRGLKTNASTNWGGAILCRTRTDRGEDNAGCDLGTPCCPTCDANHPCADREMCCKGRCVAGDCCAAGDCGREELCCANTCVAGACCAAADCPNQTCQRRSCRGNACAYAPISGEPGPRCQTVCCGGECCPEGTTGCDAQGRCGCRPGQGCGTDQICCAGACRSGDCCAARDCGTSADACADFRCACGAAPACAQPTPHCCAAAAQAICRECCADAQCPNPTAPICLDFQCVDEDLVRTFARVRAVVSRLLDVPEDRIMMASEFTRDLGADSLDLVEIILALEEEFTLTITDEQLENLDIRTVGDAVRAIDEING